MWAPGFALAEQGVSYKRAKSHSGLKRNGWRIRKKTITSVPTCSGRAHTADTRKRLHLRSLWQGNFRMPRQSDFY